MSDIIWSSNSRKNDLKLKSDEDKFNALVDRGYDPEMLNGDVPLDDIIDNDDQFVSDDLNDFENEILHDITEQTEDTIADGVILLVSDNDCIPMYVENLIALGEDMTIYADSTIEADGKKYDMLLAPMSAEEVIGHLSSDYLSYYDEEDFYTEIDQLLMEDPIEVLSNLDVSEIKDKFNRVTFNGGETQTEDFNEALYAEDFMVEEDGVQLSIKDLINNSPENGGEVKFL